VVEVAHASTEEQRLCLPFGDALEMQSQSSNVSAVFALIHVRRPWRLRWSLQNHRLCELASKTYAPTTNQKAFALKSGIKLKTLMIETVSIIRESANQT
jgi:hypothetical protein